MESELERQVLTVKTLKQSWVVWWRHGWTYDQTVVVGSTPGAVAIKWMQTGKRSRYKTNAKVNSAFHPSGLGKSSMSI